MALEEDVLNVLIDTGRQLKHDMWTANDLDVLKQRAKDLVGLNEKARVASDAQLKAKYQLAAALVVQHVQLLAQTRLVVSQAHVLDAIGALLKKVLVSALTRYLPAVFAAL